MDNRPVCIFDSGFGGLTAVRAVRKIMPYENIVFFADTGRVPYGGRPVEQLRKIAGQDIQTVSAYDPKLIIAACGTVSSNAPDILDGAKVPTIGVLRPSISRMASIPGKSPLGIIATAASINSRAFEKALKDECPDREIIAIACPDFVNIIESGHTAPDDIIVQKAVEKYLKPMKQAGIAALLLGCTHYGLISEAIENYLGKDTVLVEASECAAKAAKEYLLSNELTGGEGKEMYLTSGSADDFSEAAGVLLGRDPGKARYIPPMEI